MCQNRGNRTTSKLRPYRNCSKRYLLDSPGEKTWIQSNRLVFDLKPQWNKFYYSTTGMFAKARSVTGNCVSRHCRWSRWCQQQLLRCRMGIQGRKSVRLPASRFTGFVYINFVSQLFIKNTVFHNYILENSHFLN